MPSLAQAASPLYPVNYSIKHASERLTRYASHCRIFQILFRNARYSWSLTCIPFNPALHKLEQTDQREGGKDTLGHGKGGGRGGRYC
jgi:hypothetical protein